jgi:hypothetical protein
MKCALIFLTLAAFVFGDRETWVLLDGILAWQPAGKPVFASSSG